MVSGNWPGKWLHSLLNLMLLPSHSIAHTSPWASQIPGNDWHCVSCHKWCQDPWLQSNMSRNQACIQGASHQAKDTTQCKSPLFGVAACSSWHRVHPSLAMWILHVTHGKLAMWMDTLPWLAIGLKRQHPQSGKWKVLSLALLDLIMHTTANTLVRHSSRLPSKWAFRTRYVGYGVHLSNFNLNVHHTDQPCNLWQCIQQFYHDERVCETTVDCNWKEVQLAQEKSQVHLISFMQFCYFHRLNSCLAHIINLATQALILTYSKSLLELCAWNRNPEG